MTEEVTLAEVADCLDSAVQIGSSFRLRSGFVPIEGSPAEKEESDSIFGDLASATPAYAGMILGVVDDHLSALAKALRVKPSVWAHETLQRVVLEGCAVVAWLLDPSLTTEERAARGLTERVRSLQERLKTLETVGAPDAAVKEQTSRIENVLRITKELEWEVLRRRRTGEVTGIKTNRPYVSRMIRALFLDDGDIGRLSVGMYKMNSSVVHLALGSVAEKVTRDSPIRNDFYGIPHPAVSDIASVVAIALMAWGRGNVLLVRYCGWAEDEWRKQTAPIGHFVKRMMAIERETS